MLLGCSKTFLPSSPPSPYIISCLSSDSLKDFDVFCELPRYRKNTRDFCGRDSTFLVMDMEKDLEEP